MTENDQYRVPPRIAEVPSDHTIPQDVENAYHGAKVGLVREHAALGCKGCQNALAAYNEYLDDHSIDHEDRIEQPPSVEPAVTDGGGNHSITDYALEETD